MIRKIDAMYRLFGYGDGKCRDCCHIVQHFKTRNFYKCAIYGETASDATDWRLKWAACGQKNKAYFNKPVMEWARLKEEEKPIEGQMNFWGDGI